MKSKTIKGSVLLAGENDFYVPQTHLIQKEVEREQRSMKTITLHVKP